MQIENKQERTRANVRASRMNEWNKNGHCQHFGRNFLINTTTTTATAVRKKVFFLATSIYIHGDVASQTCHDFAKQTNKNTHTTAEKMVMLLFGVNALSTKSYTLFTMVRNFSFRFWFYFCRRFFFFTLSSSSSSSSSILVSNCKSRFFFLSRLKQRVNKRGRKCGHRVNESRKQSSILTYRIDVWHRR